MNHYLKIESIKIVHYHDECPDTSFIGEYTDKLEDGVIVRHFDEYYENLTDEERSLIPLRGREMIGFKPYAGGEKTGTEDYYKYGLQDYKRMEGLNNGDWSFIGIEAVATVSRDIGGGNRRLETLSSGGLWGIESDSGKYLNEVAKGEIQDLKEHLSAFNVNTDNFDEMAEEAMANIIYK